MLQVSEVLAYWPVVIADTQRLIPDWLFLRI